MTSLLQPLNQRIISYVKVTNIRQVFETIRAAIDVEQIYKLMDSWKSFSTADAVNFIKTVMDKSKAETVNACWKNLWSEAVNVFKGFSRIDGEVNKIILRAT
jgi:hypothetical protein